MAAGKSSATLRLLFICSVVDIASLAVLFPVLPALFASHGLDAVSMGFCTSAVGVLTFFTTPMWGTLSDRFGRMNILRVSLFGSLLSSLGTYLSHTPSLFIAARTLPSALRCFIPISQTLIVDLSSSEDRTKNLGLIGASFGVAFTIGPMLGGLASMAGIEPTLLSVAFSAINMGITLLMEEPKTHKEVRTMTDAASASSMEGALQSGSADVIDATLAAESLYEASASASASASSFSDERMHLLKEEGERMEGRGGGGGGIIEVRDEVNEEDGSSGACTISPADNSNSNNSNSNNSNSNSSNKRFFSLVALLHHRFFFTFAQALFETSFSQHLSLFYGFGRREIGLLLTYLGVVGIFANTCAISAISRLFGNSEPNLLVPVAVVEGVALVLWASVIDVRVLVASVFLLVICGSSFSTSTKSLLTKINDTSNENSNEQNNHLNNNTTSSSSSSSSGTSGASGSTPLSGARRRELATKERENSDKDKDKDKAKSSTDKGKGTSRSKSRSKVGRLLGISSSLDTLARTVAPPLGGIILTLHDSSSKLLSLPMSSPLPLPLPLPLLVLGVVAGLTIAYTVVAITLTKHLLLLPPPPPPTTTTNKGSSSSSDGGGGSRLKVD